MSVQFGRWSFEGAETPHEYMSRVSTLLAPYGPDGDQIYSNRGLTLLFRAHHTTKESRREKQPYRTGSGALVMWNGRLDNRAELIPEFSGLTQLSTDVEIVCAAFDRWGVNCFARLIGNWTLSICDPINRSALLAKDPIGPEHLYYITDPGRLAWCSVLEPLLTCDVNKFTLCEEYLAGRLSLSFPAEHLTPYAEIHAVPASSYVFVRPRQLTVKEYWGFNSCMRIRYGSDAEYEEHFRVLFRQAVRRCLRSDASVLSELSGGRDSSSIVCVADLVIAQAESETPRLDTLSYFDDSEPNWNERPYFSKVEEKRGRIGCHIDVGLRNDLGTRAEDLPRDRHPFAATPGGNGRCKPEFRDYLLSQGHRVVLSGIGGDEVMGGVPTPIPELQDYFALGELRSLAYGLRVWALERRKPWIHLFLESVRAFVPPAVIGIPQQVRPAPWLRSQFVKHYAAALTGYPTRIKLRGALPSFQENVDTLGVLKRQLACHVLPSDPPYEKRYPFLDRDLLEFLFAIPRTQLVRPTQRRSLMRRALAGIVPDEVLNKKAKAFLVRAPLLNACREWSDLLSQSQELITSGMNIVDSKRLLSVLAQARRGKEVPTVTLMRTLAVEEWLRSVHGMGLVNLRARNNTPISLQALQEN
jgi:asparagine synthase (glutamine-hydrolysing)